MLMCCLVMVFFGAVIMAVGIFRYRKLLRRMKQQIYEKKVFQNKLYGICFSMMLFFLVGYLVVGISFYTAGLLPYHLLISVIFFFGALFVLIMVEVMRILTDTIVKKSTETLQSMVAAMEAKDVYTRGHSEHVSKLSLLIWRYLPESVQMTVDPDKLRDAALLHDIGKIAIPDDILNKPSSLSPQEMQAVKLHPKNATEMLKNNCYRDISEWILYHHERIDGCGYYSLPGELIPLESRIIALADTFSALHTDRVYRKRFGFLKALEILQSVSGTQLDAELVAVFLTIPAEEVEAAGVL